MVLCNVCGLDMTKSDGCGVSKVKIRGKEYKRIKVGDKYDMYRNEGPNARCGDCGAKMGHYHHWSCDCESCPVCHDQLWGCMCRPVPVKE